MPNNNTPVNEKGSHTPDPPISVLYVDDEQDLLMLGKVFLERTGAFRVDTVTSAQEALNSSRLQSYDAIVSDYQMPGMDGIEFLKAVRDQYGAIPFILFTGRGREEVVIEALNNGADFYLQKGGDPTSQFAELANMIRRPVLQRRSEKSLRESEEQFREMAERSSDLIVILNRSMSPTYVSPSAQAITGYDPQELVGKPPDFAAATIFSPSGPDLFQGVEMTINGVVVENLETQVCRKDGTLIVVNLIAVPTIHEGVVDGVQVSMRDISRAKKMEKALKESEAKYRLLADNVHDIIWTADEKFQLSYVSPSVLTVLGYTTKEFMETPLNESLTPESFNTYTNLYHEGMDSLKTGEPVSDKVSTEIEFICRNGSTKWTEIVVTPVINRNIDRIEFIGVTRDISMRKKAEEALRKANRQLNLLSGITRHDIINKISVLKAYLALMEMDSPESASSEYFLKIKSITNDIQSRIEFTRIYEELGSHEPQWIPLDSVIPLSSLPSSVTLTADIKGISIFADPMFEKVFFNLLDNSIRHGETVSEIRVSAQQEDDDLIVVWEDNGVGINEEDKEKIFGRGYEKNTSLGMFLVREILSLTDISITENGKPGEGARFEMSVPKGIYRYPDT